MTELPAIDLSDKDSDKAFVESLRDIGFAVVRKHPLDMDLVQRIYDQWGEFFKSEEKDGYAFDKVKQDGYFSTAQAESAKGQAEQDYKEYYHFYPWGRCPEALRADLMTYYAAAHEFAKTLLGWIEQHCPAEVALRFDEPLSNMISGSDNTLLRILSYPPTKDKPGVLRAAAHEDINLITILPSADAPGLQVLDKSGEWLSVPTDSNQVIINIGDMLQEASGGYFPSTSHRVVSTESDADGQARMSCPLFLHPRSEVRLSEKHTAGSYLIERLTELGVL